MMDWTLINDDEAEHQVKFAILGVGDAGGNMLQYLAAIHNFQDAKLIYANIDPQALSYVQVKHKIYLDVTQIDITQALSRSERISQAIQNSVEEFRHQLKEIDMVFIVAGIGGQTGRVAMPLIAQIAKDMGILTVAVAAQPFDCEGQLCKTNAKKAIADLECNSDSIILIPNQHLLETYNTTITTVYRKSADIILNTVHGIHDLVNRSGYINIDFADVKATIRDSHYALAGVGIGRGYNRVREAILQASLNPLFQEKNKYEIKNLIINITSSDQPEYELSVDESELVMNLVKSMLNIQSDNIIFGTAYDASFQNEVRVNLLVTGALKQSDIV